MKKAKKSEEDFDAKSAKSNAKNAKASSGGPRVGASAGEDGGNVRVERVERVERNSRVEHREHKELGEPWPKAKLGEVCEIIAGQSPKSCFYTSDSSFLEFHQGSKHFGDRELEVSGVYTKEVTKVVEPGTLLMSVRAPVGDLNVTPRRVCIGRGLAGLLPNERIDRDFLCFFLTSATKAIDKAAGAGACFSSISKDQLASLEIPLPPLSVQRAVVARLEGEMKAVGRLEAGFREMAKAAEAAFAAELAEAFAAGAGAGEERNGRVEHKEHKESGLVGAGVTARPRGASGGSCVSASAGEPAEGGFFNAEKRRNGENAEKGFSHGATEPRRLGDCLETVSVRGHQIKQSEIAKTGKYPVVSQSENAIEGYSDLNIAIAELPVVLFGDHTCVVKKITEPFVVGADGTKLLRSKVFEIDYLYYLLTYEAKRLLDGEYRRHYSDLCEAMVATPPLAVQRSIVSRLEAAAGRRARIVALADEGAAAAADLRKAILKESFE